ncbi:MAG: hypothetical protein GW805_13600 [Ignavibacteria bacterium]|nr:hypothetical protein [Ignavibacteria bacterium]
MPNLTLKLNITTIVNPRYLLQLQFTRYFSGFITSIDFDGTLYSYTIWGKDYDIYLPAEIDKIDFNYNFDDKLIIPGIWNLSIFDNNSVLDELFFENNPTPLDVGQYYAPDLSNPVKALLYKIGDHERFEFPLDVNHTPFFSGYVYMKSLGFDDFTKMFSLSVQPDIELLKKADIHNLKAARADAEEIPDQHLSFRDNLYYLLQVAFPELKRENITIEHEFVFCAHSNPDLSHFSSNPNTIFAAGSISEYSIHELYFNVRDISNRLGINSCHEILKALCFSYFATLTVTHNKATFASINKSFRTDKTFNANRSVFSFTKEVSFERLEWIRVTEVSANSHLSHTIGTQSELTNGFDKNIALVTIMNFAVSQGVTKYILSSPFKVKDGQNNLLHVIFAKESTTATDYKTFRKLLATLWYNYLNKYSSGKIYHFQVDSVDFDFTQSIGYHDRLYSPVGIHYDIVDNSTTIDAVRN